MLLGLVAILLLSKLVFPHWKHEAVDELLDIIGMGLILFGFLFRIAARGYKEEKSFNGKALVKDGPYAIVRNPMYFGTLVIGTGFVIMLLKLWTFFLFVLIFLFIYLPQMKREEEALEARFGDEYREYCKYTPKYFPRFEHILRLKSFISLKFSWIKKEIVSLISAIVIIMAIETWEDVGLFGHKEFIEELLELGLSASVFVFIGFLLFKKEVGVS